MSELTWGVPTQRRTRVEKFSTPVVTMAAIEEGKGRKFSFNKAAIELLGLIGGESHISFGFGNDGTIAIMASVSENNNSFPLTKQCSISNKKTAEYIAKSFKLDASVENYLHLELSEGQPYAIVSHISNDNQPEKACETVSELNAEMDDSFVDNGPDEVDTLIADAVEAEEEEVSEEWD